jgi:hypothetical protein
MLASGRGARPLWRCAAAEEVDDLVAGLGSERLVCGLVVFLVVLGGGASGGCGCR